MTSLSDGGSASVPFDPFSYLRLNAAGKDRLAIYDDGREITFEELLRLVSALIHLLRERDLGRGDVVAVALPNVWQYVALEIAVPAADCVLLPLPLTLGRREAAGALRRSGAKLLVTDDSPAAELLSAAASELEPRPEAIVVEELEAELELDRGEPETSEPNPDRVVQIALTSGTTGMPKLASLTARLKQATFEGFTTRLRLGPGDRVLPLSPVTQGAGEMCLYSLRTGAALIMAHEPRFDAALALRLAEVADATVLGAVPTMISRLLEAPELASADLSRVRATLSAGSPLAPSLARRWEERTGSRVCNFYGAMDVGQLAVPDPEDPAEKRWATVGRPHDSAEVLICGPDGSGLPTGAEGEICMRGVLVQERYWNEGHGPFAADGWAHFGDLGFLDEDGYLHVTGRLKDTIIRGGTNINPYEVEDLLRECPGVKDVCVVGRPDADLGERSVAFAVPAADVELNLEGIVGFLDREGLARYKWPESLELLDTLPVGSTGKIDRRSLRERLADKRGEPA
ncbi:MAG TPA: class I adenylate-forming enzyme family protein [Solirubrobacterales bacterium]